MLDGMKVVSFCHFLQGPACTQYLADMGADVIKIEPKTGPFERHWSGAKVFVDDVSGFFLAANRNKRSLAVDLKSEEGRDLVLHLLARADVLVENFRSGVMEKLGLSLADVRAVNPSIIYASGTGWGPEGPMVGKTAQDLIIQARTGLVRATGMGRPAAVGAAVVDQHAGALLAMGICAAYARKVATGEGTHIEGSLLNSGLDLQAEPLTNYLSGGKTDAVFERQHNLVSWYHEAPYGVYELADAQVVIPTNATEKLAAALDDVPLAALSGLDQYDDRDAIADAVATAVKNWSYADLAATFDEHGIWYGRVASYDDVREDEQIIANGGLQTVAVGKGQATIVSHPLRYDGEIPAVRGFALAPGADGIEILTQLGMSEEDIADLVTKGVIHIPDGDQLVAAE